MVRAIVTARTNKPRGIDRLKDEINAGIRSANLAATAQIRRDDKTILIDGDISQQQLDSILKHTNIEYSVEYCREEQKADKKPKTIYPDDYWMIKNKARQQEEQIRNLETKISTLDGIISSLKTELKAEREKYKEDVASLQSKLKDIQTKYAHPLEVQDYISETTATEAQKWENFVKAYLLTLREDATILDMSQEALEKICLDYQELKDKPEFKELEKNLKLVREAKKLEKNPFIEIKPYAEELIDKHKRMVERDGQVREVRAELMGYAKDKVIRIALTTQEQETFVTLPYRFKDTYPRVESDLIEAIEASLKNSETQYTKENFNGLLRYRIPNMRKKAKNNLIKTIQALGDPFVKLGGKREIVGIEIY